MRKQLRLVSLGIATAGVLASMGCDAIWGVHAAKPYVVEDGGPGGGGHGGTGGVGACSPGHTQSCYPGPEGTENVGICKSGKATCEPDGTGYGDCVGAVTPQPQSCASTTDVACLGRDNCVQWAELPATLSDSFAVDNKIVFAGVATAPDGSSILAGSYTGTIPLGVTTLTTTSSAGFAIKLAPDGKAVWGKSFAPSNGETGFTAVAIDPNGDVVLGGWTSAPTDFGGGGNAIDAGAVLVKLKGDLGDLDWSETIASPCQCYPNCLTAVSPAINSLAVDAHGDIAAGGSFCLTLDVGDGPVAKPVPANQAAVAGFIAKLRGADGSGKAAAGGWSKVFGTGKSARTTSVAFDPQGTIVAAGEFDADVSFGASTLTSKGGTDIFLVKFSFPIWQVGLGDMANQYAASVASDSQGGVYLTGFSDGNTDLGGVSVTGAFVAHYTSGHQYDWSNVLPGVTPFSDKPIAIAVDTSDNIAIAGMFTGSMSIGGQKLTEKGSGDVFVAKLSPAGIVLWAKGYGGAAEDKATSIAATGAGESVLAGDTQGMIDFGTDPLKATGGRGVFVAKLSP